MAEPAPYARLSGLVEIALKYKTITSELYVQAGRYARRVTAERAPEIPEDVRDEVSHDALMNLLRFTSKDLKASGKTGKAFFRAQVLVALRQVRASYAAPGRRTRQTVMTEAEIDAEAKLPLPPPLEALPDPAAEDAFWLVEGNLRVEKAIKAAEPTVRAALTLIVFDEVEIAEAATEVGLSRFALRRRLDRLGEVLKAAA